MGTPGRLECSPQIFRASFLVQVQVVIRSKSSPFVTARPNMDRLGSITVVNRIESIESNQNE
jgi:hypothetical protein